MSWEDAKAHATRLMAAWAAQHPDGFCGARVRLADFEDEETLRFLKPEQDWSLEFHRMVLRAFAREVRRRNGRVTIVTIRLDDYMTWLAENDYENTTQNRALFINPAD